MEAARRRAEEIGSPELVPYSLTDCQQSTIETALAAPDAGMVGFERYPTLPEKAAVLLYTLSKSQACPDGNKRVAVILLQAHLALNGRTLNVGQDELAEMVLMSATSERQERERVLEELTDWIDGRSVARETER